VTEKAMENHKSKKKNANLSLSHDSSSGVQGHRKFIMQRRQTSTRAKTKECSRTIHESSPQYSKKNSTEHEKSIYYGTENTVLKIRYSSKYNFQIHHQKRVDENAI
jgi:hypothetical protein